MSVITQADHLNLMLRLHYDQRVYDVAGLDISGVVPGCLEDKSHADGRMFGSPGMVQWLRKAGGGGGEWEVVGGHRGDIHFLYKVLVKI